MSHVWTLRSSLKPMFRFSVDSLIMLMSVVGGVVMWLWECVGWAMSDVCSGGSLSWERL